MYDLKILSFVFALHDSNYIWLNPLVHDSRLLWPKTIFFTLVCSHCTHEWAAERPQQWKPMPIQVSNLCNMKYVSISIDCVRICPWLGRIYVREQTKESTWVCVIVSMSFCLLSQLDCVKCELWAIGCTHMIAYSHSHTPYDVHTCVPSHVLGCALQCVCSTFDSHSYVIYRTTSFCK